MAVFIVIIMCLITGKVMTVGSYIFRNDAAIPRKSDGNRYLALLNRSIYTRNGGDGIVNEVRSEAQHKLREIGAASVDSSKDVGSSWGNTDVNRAVVNAVNSGTESTCMLVVSDGSKYNFQTNVLKHRYNFVHMRLRFNGLNVSAAEDVIDGLNWIWTYKGVNGAHQYLFLPNDFGYLSIGLLWVYTHVEHMDIVLNATDVSQCNNLTVGLNDTDNIIGKALGNMTGSALTDRSDNYNSSYWCYTVRLKLKSHAVYVACKNSICTMQTIEYRCCKFQIDYVTRNRTVMCQKEHYHFGYLWWLLPILIGEICFAFYPILLTKIGCKLSKLQRRHKRQQRDESQRLARLASYQSDGAMSRSVSVEMQSVLDMPAVLRKNSIPVTLMSTLISPLGRCDINSKLFSRLIRIAIILLPMTLTIIRVALDYRYASEFVRKAVRKGALVGFSSVIAGPGISQHDFLRIFGGPYVAVFLYIVFGCILILLPYNLEALLETGLFELNGVSSSPILLSIDSKEKLGGVEIRKSKGFKKMHKYLLAQLFLLLNRQFWQLTMKLFVTRLSINAYTAIRWRLGNSCWAKIAVLVLTPPYVALCAVELVVTVVYFAFPVISCFFILLKAYIGAAIGWLAYRSPAVRWTAKLLFLPLLLILVFTWYMYCIIFFDGFVFLSKIAMFTYSGTIAYPKVSYGYIILSFMAVYYLLENFSDFGTGYQELLRLSIDVCVKLESRAAKRGTPITIIHDKGIPAKLFEAVIERHRPRRIQVASTFLKFGAVLSILIISIELLLTFDKLQDLSLVSHVFTVLFICTLPKIIKNLCVTTTDRRRKIQKQKIMRTVEKYMRSEQQDDTFAYDSPGRLGYESLLGDDRENDRQSSLTVN